MFPLTHVYICQKVLERLNHQLILGTTFPDTVIESPLEYRQTHTMGKEFMEFINLNTPKLKDFAKGVILHGVEPRGVDYYCDEKFPGCERGFCFEKAKPLVREVVSKCGVPEDFGWWKAHNVVEMGIELKISDEHPDLVGILKEAYNNLDLIHRIGSALGAFFKMPADEINQGIIKFSRFLGNKPLTSKDLAQKFELQMNKRHSISINIEACSQLIQRCRDDADKYFEEFLNLFLRNLPELE